MKKKALVLCVAGVLFVGGAGYYFLFPTSKDIPATQLVQEVVPPELGSNSLPPVRKAPDGFKEYRSGQYHFSLLHPSFLEIKEYDEDSGKRTISFESLEDLRGFQIFIMPYRDSQVTKERFRLDNPSGVRKDLKNITVAGAPGVAFYSFDPFLGDTQEVWFIRDGYLYEVTTFKELDAWLAELMETWVFI